MLRSPEDEKGEITDLPNELSEGEVRTYQSVLPHTEGETREEKDNYSGDGTDVTYGKKQHQFEQPSHYHGEHTTSHQANVCGRPGLCRVKRDQGGESCWYSDRDWGPNTTC